MRHFIAVIVAFGSIAVFAAAINGRPQAVRTQDQSFVSKFHDVHRIDFDNLIDVGILERSGVNRLNVILLRGICRALVQHDPGNPDDVIRSAAASWHHWHHQPNAAMLEVEKVLADHAWALRRALLSASTTIWIEAAFLNWAVSELQRVAILPLTPALIIIACHMIMARPQLELRRARTTLERVARSIANDGDLQGGCKIVLPPQFHIQVQLYSRAMQLGDRDLLNLGRGAASGLNPPDIEPIMFLISVLTRIERRATGLGRRLHLIRELRLANNQMVILALAYYLQKDSSTVEYLAGACGLFTVLEGSERPLLARDPTQSEVTDLLDFVVFVSVCALAPPGATASWAFQDQFRSARQALRLPRNGWWFIRDDRDDPERYARVKGPLKASMFVAHIKSLAPVTLQAKAKHL